MSKKQWLYYLSLYFLSCLFNGLNILHIFARKNCSNSVTLFNTSTSLLFSKTDFQADVSFACLQRPSLQLEFHSNILP